MGLRDTPGRLLCFSPVNGFLGILTFACSFGVVNLAHRTLYFCSPVIGRVVYCDAIFRGFHYFVAGSAPSDMIVFPGFSAFLESYQTGTPRHLGFRIHPKAPGRMKCLDPPNIFLIFHLLTLLSVHDFGRLSDGKGRFS